MATKPKCPEETAFRAMLDGTLAEDQVTELANHLETCEGCRTTFESLAGGGAGLPCSTKQLGNRSDKTPDTLLRRVANLSPTTAENAPTALDSESRATASSQPNGQDLVVDFLSPSDHADHLGRLGTYEITELIGRGGMGIVLRGQDTRLNRCVAIKVLAPQLATNAAARKRFLREGQAAAAVSHDHVVRIYAVDEINGLPFLVMECIDGISLDQRIKRDGPLELKEILRIGMQAASGLAAAHAQGLVHRDIKPANILLENGVERVKITDFGLARAADDARLTQDGVLVGTPQYMSPEQARGEPTGPSSDLFSLGCVLYAMCTGRSPFRADTVVDAIRRVCDDTPRPIQQVNPEIPDWLAEIIDTLLQKSPEHRLYSAPELAELLSQHLAHVQTPSLAPRPSARKPIPKPVPATTRHTRPRMLVAAAIVGMFLTGFALTEATGVTEVSEFVATVLRIQTGDGTVVVKIMDPGVQVTVDKNGDTITLTGIGDHEIKLKPGPHRFQAIRNGKTVQNEWVTVTRGGKNVVEVTMEPRDGSDQLAPVGPGAGIDLLALIDPKRDGIFGQWELQDHEQALATWGRFSSLQVPIVTPEEYDIIAVVERAVGVGQFGISVSFEGKRGWIVIDSRLDTGGVSALRVTEDIFAQKNIHEHHRGQLLPQNQPTEIRCAIRRDGERRSIRVMCGGRTAIDWTGRSEELASPDSRLRLTPGTPELSKVGDGVFRVTKLELVPLSGLARPVFSAESAPSDRQVAELVCWIGGSAWVSADGGETTKIERLEALPSSLVLKQVDINHRSQRSLDEFLNRLANCAALERLVLSFTEISAKELGKLTKLARLHSLDLAGTNVTDEGCSALAKLEQLEELDLCGTAVSANGVSRLRTLHRLKRLRLDHTSIDDRALTLIAELPSLTSLSLVHTAVTDDGLAALKKSKSLTTLSLIGTRATTNAVQELRRSLPSCTLEHDTSSHVDLLKLIDVDRDSVRGQWTWDGEVLLCPVFDHASLQIPYVPPREYSLEAIVQREQSSTSVVLGIVQQPNPTALILDSWPNLGWISAFDTVDGILEDLNETQIRGRVIRGVDETTICVVVRKQGITAKCGDRLIADWKGDPRRLSAFAPRSGLRKDALFIGAYKSRYRFSKLQLTPISGQGRFIGDEIKKPAKSGMSAPESASSPEAGKKSY